MGPFVTASCLSSGAPPTNVNRKQAWRLSATRAAGDSSLQFSLKVPADAETANATEMAQLTFQTNLTLEKILGHQKILDNLAIYFSEAMPFRALTSLKRLKKSPIVVASTSPTSNCAKMPEILTLYTLTYRDTLWRPQVLATSQKGKTSGGKTSYQFDLSALGSNDDNNRLLFLHNSSRPRENLESLQRCISTDIETLTRKWYALASSAYVGIRYGYRS